MVEFIRAHYNLGERTMSSSEKRGFCLCGPNNLGVGEKCEKCDYFIPSQKYVRKHFWITLFWAVLLGIAAFFFVALPLITFFDGNIFWKVLAALFCGLFSIKSVRLMGPYYDGEVRWEESGTGEIHT